MKKKKKERESLELLYILQQKKLVQIKVLKIRLLPLKQHDKLMFKLLL